MRDLYEIRFSLGGFCWFRFPPGLRALFGAFVSAHLKDVMNSACGFPRCVCATLEAHRPMGIEISPMGFAADVSISVNRPFSLFFGHGAFVGSRTHVI